MQPALCSKLLTHRHDVCSVRGRGADECSSREPAPVTPGSLPQPPPKQHLSLLHAPRVRLVSPFDSTNTTCLTCT
eukprot:1894734-Rhodomonas_salina.3